MLQPLQKKHLARLSPVMHAYNHSFVRPEWGVPITGMSGLGDNYEKATKDSPGLPQGTRIDPRGEALWSNLYRIGAAGSLSRTTPFGPAAFSGVGCCSGLGTNGNGNGNGASSRPLGERVRDMAPLLLALGATVGVLFLVNR
jgi:hypothetical protein